jgi:hypothetical protein
MSSGSCRYQQDRASKCAVLRVIAGGGQRRPADRAARVDRVRELLDAEAFRRRAARALTSVLRDFAEPVRRAVRG